MDSLGKVIEARFVLFHCLTLASRGRNLDCHHVPTHDATEFTEGSVSVRGLRIAVLESKGVVANAALSS